MVGIPDLFVEGRKGASFSSEKGFLRSLSEELIHQLKESKEFSN